MTDPRVEPPSPEVASAPESRLPGTHRGGFSRLPTAPVDVGTSDVFVPAELDVEAVRPPRGIAAWALAFAIAGLVGSMFVGWAFPLGLAAIVLAVLALRQPWDSRSVSVWAIVLGGVSVVYSAGWLVYAVVSSA